MRERVRYLKPSCVRLADRHAQRVVQAAKAEVPADRYVVALPKQIRVVVRDALCPVTVRAHRATSLELVRLEQHPLIGLRYGGEA